MFCSKYVDIKWHSVYFPEIKKIAVSSLVSNLLASQIEEFFLLYPVVCWKDGDVIQGSGRVLCG